MSLIQQALDKTSRAQETRTTTPALTPKPWERDPTGTVLEEELVQVQREYARQRAVFWRVALGILIVCLIAGMTFIGIWKAHSTPKTPSVTRVMPQAPLKIYSGNIYRLTGITDAGGKAIAIINDKLVGVGDALDGKAVVKSISKGEVRLDVQGKEIQLTL